MHYVPPMTFEVTFTDARGVLANASAYLASEPVLHTVLSTVAHRLVDAPVTTQPRWFAIVSEADRTVGVAMRTAPFPPHPVYVLPMPEAAARALGEALRARGEAVTELNGFLPALEHLGAGLGKRPVMRERLSLFELATPRAPTTTPTGSLRVATDDDIELVHRWFNEFGLAAAAQAGRPAEDHGERVSLADVTKEIANGLIRIWDDGGPVHVSAARPPSFGVARIGPVYTPAEHRGRGYAGATVHALAEQLLAEGARVCLFADQANPISTRLYESLGFRAVAETALVALRQV